MTLRELLDHYSARPEPAPMLTDDEFIALAMSAAAARHARRMQRLRNEATTDTDTEYME